jgi:hypothetical protein
MLCAQAASGTSLEDLASHARALKAGYDVMQLHRDLALLSAANASVDVARAEVRLAASRAAHVVLLA